MKKEFLTGLTALVLAIGLALAGCESPTNGSNGGSGSNALPAATATTLDGINKFFDEGYPIVYLVGEVTLVEGQTLAIPDSHSVIVTSTGDLNGRAVAADGKGKVTVAGGTLTLGTTSGKLRFLADSPFTFTGGTINGTGSIVIDDVGAAIALLGNDAFVTAAGSAQVGIGDNPPVAVDTTKVVSDAPESAGSEEIKTALGSKDVVFYTNAAGLSATNIGANIADTKTLVVTNPAATVTISGATLTVGTGSTGATLQVAGNIVVGNETTPANNITLVSPTITTGTSDTVALNGSDETVILTGNTSQPVLSVGGTSSIGAGLKIVPANAGTPATLSTKATGDIITLTGGVAGSSKIGTAAGDFLILSGGSIVASNTGETAITTFGPGSYVTTATAASLLLSSGVIEPNSNALTLSAGAKITTKDATTLTPTNLAFVRGAATTTADNADVVYTAAAALASPDLNGFVGKVVFEAGASAVAITAITTDGIFTFGASATLPANTALVVNSTTMATLVLGGDLTTTGSQTLKITGNAATLNVGGGLFKGGTAAKYVLFPIGTFSVSGKSFTPAVAGGAIDFEATGGLKLQNGATLVVGANTFAAGAAGGDANEIVFVDTAGTMVLSGTAGLKINHDANTALVQAKGTALITSLGADADNYLKLTGATIGLGGDIDGAYSELKAGVLTLVYKTSNSGALTLGAGGTIVTKGTGKVAATADSSNTNYLELGGGGTGEHLFTADRATVIAATGADSASIKESSAAASAFFTIGDASDGIQLVGLGSTAAEIVAKPAKDAAGDTATDTTAVGQVIISGEGYGKVTIPGAKEGSGRAATLLGNAYIDFQLKDGSIVLGFENSAGGVFGASAAAFKFTGINMGSVAISARNFTVAANGSIASVSAETNSFNGSGTSIVNNTGVLTAIGNGTTATITASGASAGTITKASVFNGS